MIPAPVDDCSCITELGSPWKEMLSVFVLRMICGVMRIEDQSWVDEHPRICPGYWLGDLLQLGVGLLM